MAANFNSARIIGSGLIGTSIALCLKTSGVLVQMVDIDARSQGLANDLVNGENIDKPDLIIISASINRNLELVVEELNRNPGSIVLDIASIKSNLLNEVAKLSENAENFISSHPMAGREVSGAESARADLFLGRAWIGIKSEVTSDRAKDYLNQLVSICGSTLYWLNSKDHDQSVAAISHLPQIVSTALAYSLDKKEVRSFELAGQGLRDVLRLSGSNPEIWSELLVANKDAIKPFLEEMKNSINLIQQSLNDGSAKELEEIFKIGNEVYKKIPGKHGGKNRNYSYLSIVIDDQPGQLAKIFDDCAKVKVNVEDLSIEHSPGQQTGLITLALNESDSEKLLNHLTSAGWNVHSLKSR